MTNPWVTLRCGSIFALLSVVCPFSVWAEQATANGNFIAPIGAQDSTSHEAATAVRDATKKGFPLSSSSTDVTGNISVEAVLIPARIAKTVFGKEVANNYAVIALTISNRSSEESFIVHTVFVDYSQWLLSGGSPYPAPQPYPTPQRNENPLPSWQQWTLEHQIDSVENRIVRGELLDRQPWTTRNWVLRALQAAGSIASGFTFATSSDGWIRGIGAFNATVIPAAQTLWPDATIGQMNRISDFGFQVNKVIAKQSSDIVVAFFPIDRFLPPDLASLFISSPSVFFVPLAALPDPKTYKRIKPYIDAVVKDNGIGILMQNLYQVVSGKCPAPNNTATATSIPTAAPAAPNPNPVPIAPDDLEKACQTAELVNRLSLNVVRVRVGGTMTVDVNKVPPRITEIQIDQDRDGTATWQKGTNLTGVIRGSFLGGATPVISSPDGKLFQVTGVAESSSDTALHFTIALNDNLPRQTSKLSFQVSKKSDGSTITSPIYDYTIQSPPKADSATGSGAGGTASIAKPQNAPTGTPPGTPQAAPSKPKELNSNDP